MKFKPTIFIASVVICLLSISYLTALPLPQQQVSGGGSVSIVQGGNTATVNGSGQLSTINTQTGTWTVQPGNTANTTAWLVTGTGGTFPISGSIGNTAFALNSGVANIGIIRTVPSPCTQSTNFTNSTVGVATGAGTTVTSTTTCVTKVYVNNITNSGVTFRLADKQGTPVIWVGGNADFIIPANSNVSFPLEGVLFTSGITAIAGTAAAINLQVSGLQ